MLKTETKSGSIIINNSVIYNIISNIADHCFGIAGMAAKNVTEEFWDLFKRDKDDKGIHVTIVDNQICIDLHIMVTYGINIPAITDSIVHKVVYTLEQITDFKVQAINVYIDSVAQH